MNINRESLCEDLIGLFSDENVIHNDQNLLAYGTNHLGVLVKPLVVVKPTNISQFKRLNFILKRHHIGSITPRGGGLGINFGAFSEDLIIDLSLLNKKLHIDSQKRIITTEGGKSFKALQTDLQKEGFRLPVEALLNGTIGGFIATGGFGFGSYKYGSILNFLRQSTLVLPDGKILKTGTPNTPDYCHGYNLHSVFCGSEGYLGIISEVIIEVIPEAPYSQNILLSFGDNDALYDVNTVLNKLSSIYNISLFKGLHLFDATQWNFLIRLEGIKEQVDEDKALLQALSDVKLSCGEDIDKIWEGRVMERADILPSSLIIETIVPLKQLISFVQFCEQFDEPKFFGIFINTGELLLYTQFSKNRMDPRNGEIFSAFLDKGDDLHLRPPSMCHIIPEFVEKANPNWQLFRELKGVFDKLNRMKSRTLAI